MDVDLLLITFAFPPAGGVGVLRAHSFAKHLPNHDIHVEVLTTRNTPSAGEDISLLRNLPASVVIHRTATLDLPFSVRKRIKRLLVARYPPVAPVHKASRLRAIASTVKSWIADLLLPDPQIGWLPFAIRAARKIIVERHIDVVLVTVPPFSTARIVGALRETYPELPIILDFRDEWLDSTLQMWSFNATEKAKRVARSVESESVHAATRVIAVTRAALRSLTDRYPLEPPEKFVYIPNGFSDEQMEVSSEAAENSPARTERRVTFTYIGSLYGSTDPSTLFEALALLPDALRSRLHFRFVGHIENNTYLEKLKKLGDLVELHGFLPQAEALAYMRDTDYLLLISHDPINVSAKFYDYLSGGKPILGLVSPGGDIKRLIEETRAGLWVDVANPADIAAKLHEIADGKVTDDILNTPVVMQYRRSVLAERLAKLCHGLDTRPCRMRT